MKCAALYYTIYNWWFDKGPIWVHSTLAQGACKPNRGGGGGGGGGGEISLKESYVILYTSQVVLMWDLQDNL